MIARMEEEEEEEEGRFVARFHKEGESERAP